MATRVGSGMGREGVDSSLLTHISTQVGHVAWKDGLGSWVIITFYKEAARIYINADLLFLRALERVLAETETFCNPN